MAKKYLTIIFVGFLFWIFINAFFYPMIVNLVINEGYPVFINHIYFFCIYFLIGLFIGWRGNSKGWLLSLVFGIIITIFFILISIFSNFLEVELSCFGYFGTLVKLLITNLLFIFYLTVGGFLGGHIKNKFLKNDSKRQKMWKRTPLKWIKGHSHTGPANRKAGGMPC